VSSTICRYDEFCSYIPCVSCRPSLFFRCCINLFCMLCCDCNVGMNYFAHIISITLVEMDASRLCTSCHSSCLSLSAEEDDDLFHAIKKFYTVSEVTNIHCIMRISIGVVSSKYDSTIERGCSSISTSMVIPTNISASLSSIPFNDPTY